MKTYLSQTRQQAELNFSEALEKTLLAYFPSSAMALIRQAIIEDAKKNLRTYNVELVATDGSVYRHNKRSTVYTKLQVVHVQCDKPITDNEVLTLYRSIEHGNLYVRPPKEFNDVSRFAKLSKGET